ncbi:MAG: hypothetical protein ACI4XR_00065 [Bacilli bacterium]
MKKLNKNYIIIITIFLLFFICVLVYIFLIRNNDNNNIYVNNTSNNINNNITNNNLNISNNTSNISNNTTNITNVYYYLTIDEFTMFRYSKKNNVWQSTNIDTLNNKKMNVYINNNYFGNYYIYFGRNWSLLNDNKEYVSYDGKFIAFSKELNIKPINYSEGTFTNNILNEVKKILNNSDYNVIENIHNNLIYYITENRYIVIATNLYNVDTKLFYNLIYYNNAGNIEIILKNSIGNSARKDYPTYYLKDIITIDNKLTFIFGKMSYEGKILQSNMYQFNNNKFIKLV